MGLLLVECIRTKGKFGETRMENRKEDGDLLPECHPNVVVLSCSYREVLQVRQVISFVFYSLEIILLFIFFCIFVFILTAILLAFCICSEFP